MSRIGPILLLCILLSSCLLAPVARSDERQQYLNRCLRSACRKGNEERVKFLLDKGAQVNVADRDDWTPLLVAVDQQQRDVVRLLLARGANVNIRNKYGTTPLLRAASASDVETVKLLLAAGADSNAADRQGSTPLLETKLVYDFDYGDRKATIRQLLRQVGAHFGLMEAIRVEDVPAARAMLTGEAMANISDRKGVTPLMMAATLKDTTLLRLLLAHSAKTNAVDTRGRTALMYAAGASWPRSPKAVPILLKHAASVNRQDSDGKTALMYAAHEGDRESVLALLDHGANLEARDKQGKTALMHAASWRIVLEGGTSEPGSLAIGPLLARGADVHAADKEGRTALLIAAEDNPDDRTIRALLKAGAQVNVRDKRGITALMYEALYNRRDNVNTLRRAGARVGLLEALFLGDGKAAKAALARGAAVNVRGPHGLTPLMVAIRQRELVVVKRLLTKGASVNAAEENGITALDFAVGAKAWGLYDGGGFGQGGSRPLKVGDEPELVSLLIRYGAKGQGRYAKSLVWAVSNGFLRSAEYLVTHGADLRSRHGVAALHAAIAGKHTEMVRLLLRHGVDVNAVDDASDTPLNHALYDLKRAEELVPILLDAGADVNRRGQDNQTPLSIAAEAGSIPLLQQILAHGAKIDMRGYAGRTALMGAATKGNLAIVQALLAAHADPELRDWEDKTALDYATQEEHKEVIELLSHVKAHLSSWGRPGGILGAGRLSHARRPLERAAFPRRVVTGKVCVERDERQLNSCLIPFNFTPEPTELSECC